MLPGSEKKFYGSRKICTGKKACLRLKNSPLRRTREIFFRSDFTLRGNRVRATTWLNQNIGFRDRKKSFTGVEKYLRVKKPFSAQRSFHCVARVKYFFNLTSP